MGQDSLHIPLRKEDQEEPYTPIIGLPGMYTISMALKYGITSQNGPINYAFHGTYYQKYFSQILR